MRVIENGSIGKVAARLRVRVTWDGRACLSLEGGLAGDLIWVALEALGRSLAPRCAELQGEDAAKACI